MRPTGLEQNRVTGIGEHRHERQHIFLQERLASGDLDQQALKRAHRLRDFFERQFLPLVERVLGIAISAAQIAKREAYKNARLSCPGALSLDRVIDFVNRQSLLAL